MREGRGVLSTSSLSLPAAVAADQSADEYASADDDDSAYAVTGCLRPDTTPARRHSFHKLQSVQPADNIILYYTII